MDRAHRPNTPALKGAGLGDPAALAATAKFRRAQVNRYGRADTAYLAEVSCLWYGSFHTRAVRVILLRDDGTDTATTWPWSPRTCSVARRR